MNNKQSNYQVSQKDIADPCRDKPGEIRCATCIMDTSYFFLDLSLEAKAGQLQ